MAGGPHSPRVPAPRKTVPMAKKPGQGKAPPPVPSPAPPRETNVYDFLIRLTDGTCRLLTKSLWPATCCFVAYATYLGVAELAGKTTEANIAANLIAKLTGFDRIIAYMAGASGVGWGMYESRNKKKAIANLRKQQEEYEKIADPNRTGSGLLPGGDLPPDRRE